MKRVLITGANRGLGLELVLQCVQRGDHVFAGCRSPEKAVSLKEVSVKYPGQVTILPLEVTDEESIVRCAAKVAAEIDGLELVFNNAAIHTDGEHLSEVNAETMLKLIHVNAVGAVLVAKAFVNLQKKGTDPKLVNISSESGSIERMRDFRGYNYYGSKAAMNMYTRSLAWDPETGGITVIAIHPGWVRTDMGGSNADISTAQSVEGILQVTEGLTSEENGKFYTWEGQEYPW